MMDFMKLLLGLSLAGTAVAGLVALARRLLRGRVPHRVFYYLWLAVVLRLLLPVGLGSQVAGWAGDLLAPTTVQQVESQEPPAADGDNRPTVEPDAGAVVTGETPMQQAGEMQITQQPGRLKSVSFVALVLFLVWFTGMICLLLYRVFAWLEIVAHLKNQQPVKEQRLLQLYGGECEGLGIASPPLLVVDPGAPSPLLAGLIRPIIVLPDTNMEPDKLALVLRHELIHYKRGDLWYRWLLQLAVCVHWFNPFVYRVRRAIEKDCEYSCDAAVLRGLDATGRRRYGEALMGALLRGPARPYSPVVMLGEQAADVKKRLEGILHGGGYGKRAVALGLCCVLAVAGFAACTGGSLPTGAAAGGGQAGIVQARQWQPETARPAVQLAEGHTHYSTEELAGLLRPLALEDMPKAVADAVLYEGSEQNAYLIEAGGKRYVYCNMGASASWLYTDIAREGLTLRFLGQDTANRPQPLLAELLYEGSIDVFYTEIFGEWMEPLFKAVPFGDGQVGQWDEAMTDKAIVDLYNSQSVYISTFNSHYPTLYEDSYIHCHLEFSNLAGSSKTAAFTLEEDTVVDIAVTGLVEGPYKAALFRETGFGGTLVYAASDHNGVGSGQTLTLTAGTYQLVVVGEEATGFLSIACVRAGREL